MTDNNEFAQLLSDTLEAMLIENNGSFDKDDIPDLLERMGLDNPRKLVLVPEGTNENNRIRLESICPICDKGFNEDEWFDRHTADDGWGSDIHEDCCTECNKVTAQGDFLFGGISSGQASEDELRMILSFVKGEE